MYRYATLVAFGLIAGPAHAGDLFELQGESRAKASISATFTASSTIRATMTAIASSRP